MPNSLKTKLSKLRYQGKITDEEYKELIDKLEGHDEAITAQIMWERDTAINQLEQLGYGLGEKIEPCEDCVSREEAIRVAEQGQIQGYEWQFKKLCNSPSVKSQRPKGKWMGTVCTNCGNSIGCYYDCDFCPMCGAEMEGEE